MSSRSRSSSFNSRSEDQNSNPDNRKRFKYCCRKCKHTEGNKKSCVCVVPMSQRRTQIGQKGCQTCGCKGCSIQDFLSRGEDPEYKPSRIKKDFDRGSGSNERFDPKNGCCRKCMKAFSKTGKSCLCQVPRQVRKSKLPAEGCKICGCHGCNPRDYSQSGSNRSGSQSNSVRSRGGSVDERQHNLNNVDNSIIGKIIVVEYNLYPGMLGLGIPQRTPNYILGRPL